ncbi:MAG: hypothetical protein M3O70_27410 [Actinomycetota bacterium]|nr:hypothetical protein [Actinomycetota bacterium]
MLTVLETLGPTERAVFVLREVFGTPYDEIAGALEKSPAAVRQIANRARGARGRPPAPHGGEPSPAEGRRNSSARRCGTAPCKVPSTCLPPTWCSSLTAVGWPPLHARSRVRTA